MQGEYIGPKDLGLRCHFGRGGLKEKKKKESVYAQREGREKNKRTPKCLHHIGKGSGKRQPSPGAGKVKGRCGGNCGVPGKP